MRIAHLIAQHRFEVAAAPPPPPPGPGEVQVRVHAVGICGSDLHNFAEGAVGDTPSVYPMVLGHEPTGTIVGTGERVILEPAVYCYHCEMCRSGRHNLCVHIRFYSAGPDPGFFRDIVNLPEHNVLPLPAGLGFAEGTLFEPLAIALHSMQFVKLTPGETVAVWGCGPIGVLTIAVLRMQGARRIYAIDPVPHRRAMATAYGADVVLAPDEALPEIRSGSGGHLFLSTNYTIEGHQLTVRCGFLYHSTIDIQTITKISETNNLISSPAISLDRLEIRFGSHNSVIISPREKQDFLDHLLQINPKISIQYKKR